MVEALAEWLCNDCYAPHSTHAWDSEIEVGRDFWRERARAILAVPAVRDRLTV